MLKMRPLLQSLKDVKDTNRTESFEGIRSIGNMGNMRNMRNIGNIDIIEDTVDVSDINEEYLQFAHVTAPASAAGIIQMALAYPYPHNILGKEGADHYVLELLSKSDGRTKETIKDTGADGWYTGSMAGQDCVACYLSIYGIGNGIDHTLWKIRHPILMNSQSKIYLPVLFQKIGDIVLCHRPGSAKIVIFLGENETPARWAAEKAGFQQEACFSDYYRLGENCFVYGKTVKGT